jgi:hypothetical protein
MARLSRDEDVRGAGPFRDQGVRRGASRGRDERLARGPTLRMQRREHEKAGSNNVQRMRGLLPGLTRPMRAVPENEER